MKRRISPAALREWRTSLGYSQTGLAQELGVTFQAVSNWETEPGLARHRGIGRQTEMLLRALAERHGVEPPALEKSP